MDVVLKRVFGMTDPLRIHDAILRKRTTSKALIRAMRVLDLDKNTLATVLSVSDATMNRRLKSKAALTKREAECLWRLAHMVDLANRRLGSIRRARRWLVHPLPALEGMRPIDLLSTELAGRGVERILYAIDDGRNT